MFNKVFCIGFNKTGTSSLHQLFLDLGLTSLHAYYSHFPVRDPIFAQFQCFSDGDQHDFAALDQAWPGSKFILTTRPFEDWLISRIRHVEQRRHIGASGPMREEYEANPGLAVRRWIERRLRYHGSVRDYFLGRENDLLVVNVCDSGAATDSVTRIGRFLGLQPLVGMRMPHENAAPGEIACPQPGAIRPKAVVRDEVRAAFQSLGIDDDVQRSLFP